MDDSSSPIRDGSDINQFVPDGKDLSRNSRKKMYNIGLILFSMSMIYIMLKFDVKELFGVDQAGFIEKLLSFIIGVIILFSIIKKGGRASINTDKKSKKIIINLLVRILIVIYIFMYYVNK